MQRGNDITFVWKIKDPAGQPVDLSKFDKISLYIQNANYPSIRILPEFVIDNGLRFVFQDFEQKASGFYNLVMLAELQGKNYKVDHVKAFELTDHATQHCVVGDDDHMTEISTCLSRYMDGRDGRSPYISQNGNWFVYDDLLRAFTDTGKLADYADLFALEVKKVTDTLVVAGQAISDVNATNEAVVRNENARVEEERSRVAEESERSSAESTRVGNETARGNAEQGRANAESSRVTAESSRVTVESKRVTAESSRVSAEQNRVSAENTRSTAESGRSSAETNRVNQENTRKSNETTRVNAESARVSAEQSRVTEEGKRVTAENKRQTDTAKAIHNANTATESATNAANTVDAKVAEAIKPIEANKLDRSEFDLQRQPVYGLGFKSGDNTVNLTTPEINLGLNDFTVEVWARMEGAGDFPIPLLGFSGSSQAYRNMKILRDARYANAIGMIMMQSPIGGFEGNSVFINKLDSTKNLHHIIITRQGTLVTATINGRLVKSVTQDRVLDFSQFVFDIANTTYFSLGRVFNYAMSADEVQALWNGGRVDEVVLDSRITTDKTISSDLNSLQWLVAMSLNNRTNPDGTKTMYAGESRNFMGWLWFSGRSFFSVDDDFRKPFAYLDIVCHQDVKLGQTTYPKDFSGIIKLDYDVIRINSQGGQAALFYDVNTKYASGDVLTIKSIKSSYSKCLLELLPSSIHSKGIYNSGSLGSSHDAVLSKPAETIFIKERPYKDKQMSTGAPNFHPIAMGQECTDQVSGSIYKASVPPVGREWAVSDWKQINNS